MKMPLENETSQEFLTEDTRSESSNQRFSALDKSKICLDRANSTEFAETASGVNR